MLNQYFILTHFYVQKFVQHRAIGKNLAKYHLHYSFTFCLVKTEMEEINGVIKSFSVTKLSKDKSSELFSGSNDAELHCQMRFFWIVNEGVEKMFS